MTLGVNELERHGNCGVMREIESQDGYNMMDDILMVWFVIVGSWQHHVNTMCMTWGVS